MIPISLYELSRALEPSEQVFSSVPVTGFSTDSRTTAPGDVFFALVGENFDGHAFVKMAEARGAVAAVVNHRQEGVSIAQIVVDDTGVAYGKAGAFCRSEFTGVLVMVVGSNGKTTTKEMCAAVLRAHYGDEAVVATEGNLNNQVGVPKTLQALDAQKRGAVIEAGINHVGEMAYLASWVRPDIVLVTNAQREHQEFLNGVRESARENGLAIVGLSPHGTAVLPADDPEFGVWRDLARARSVQVLTYSTTPGVAADYVGEVRDGLLLINGQPHKVQDLSAHTVHNMTGVYAAMLAAGIPQRVINKGLADFSHMRGRGARLKTPDGRLLVIDEAYNANPDSVRATMAALATSPISPKIYVLGDMGEVGVSAEQMHRELGEYAREVGIDQLLTVGPLAALAAQSFGEGAEAFESIEAVAARLANAHGVVTVKASHFMRLDRLVDQLLQQS
mgnify:CR=1 FL=1